MAETRRLLSGVLEMLLWLVAMLTLLQVLFGQSFVDFFGIDIVNNIGIIVAKFGNAGLVGIVAAGLIAFLIVRERPNRSNQSSTTPNP